MILGNMYKRVYCVLLIIFIMSNFSVIYAADSEIKFGGAVRYNLMLQDYEDDNITTNDGQFTWDTWRINIDGKNSAGIILSFEYRFYPTFDTHFIHHGWFGYDITEQTQVQLGVSQVPFGDQAYASHSWWFSGAYYMGLEDDYDMGLKFLHKKDNWDFALAYYFQPEPAGPAPGDVSYGVGGSGRYSYDIIPVEGEHNQERNQINARAAYKFSNSEVGLSVQYGQIFNSVLNKSGSHKAVAGHIDANVGNLNAKVHAIYYNHDVKNDLGTELDVVQMGAYGSGTYAVAAEAMVYTLGLAYTVPVSLGPISSIQFYNDYTLTDKTVSSFTDTQQNILGFLTVAGGVYTYFDVAMGKNQPWITQNFGKGLGIGDSEADWNIRYNINFGYYF